jgi:uncharacterized surface protein with fasciclin (FAS1) repeats
MMFERSSIIDTLDKNGKFSTFARLLRTSKADSLITGAGPFTVFAPTNDAFSKVPDAQMNGLLSQTDQTGLAKLLSYHMVASKLFATNLGSRAPVATLSGAEVTFSDTNGLKVNESGVLSRNIEATNGIIHSLDTVLSPAENPMAASAVTASARSTLLPTPAVPTSSITQADGHSDAAPVPPNAAAEVMPTPLSND